MDPYIVEETWEDLHYRYNNLAGCNPVPPATWQGVILDRCPIVYGSVESYRGKPVYVDVGSKRRKKFHSFRRIRYNRVGGSCMARVCVMNAGPGYNYSGWSEDFPYPDLWTRFASDPTSAKGSTWDGDIFPSFYGGVSGLGKNFRDFVIRDVYAKANQPRFNTAVFVAELDETLVGIHGLFKNCLQSLFRTRMASKNIRHLLLNPEELWLWWRYMLMPTMMDVEDLIAAFQRQLPIDRVQDGDSYDEPLLISGTTQMKGFGRGYVTVDVEWRSEVTVGCGAAMDIFRRYDPAEWGTSSWDVLMATWERIPFSFIADWFINVGDWLSSLRSIDLEIAQSYATYAIETSTEVLSADPYISYSGNWPTISTFVMDRITDIEPPKLPLVDKRWRNILRTIDLISLTIGMLKGVLRRRK